MRVDKKAQVLVEHIKEMHVGAISNIVMTKESFDESYVDSVTPSDIIDPNKSLKDNGISTSERIRVIYDFKATSYPLLDFLPRFS